MSKVIEITDQNFEEEVLNSELPTEVDFWAPWCGPCMIVSPIYDRLSEEYDGRFKFCKINVDENQRTAAKYQIMSIPMQMFFSDGEKVDEILGAVPEQTIRTMIEDILKSFPTDEAGRLKVIFTSWVEHNKKHREQFSKWLEKTEKLGGNPLYDGAMQAVRQMENADARLSEVLVRLQEEG
ncbi:MAG: thioredoxin [Deltaproteobacteria bacterium]|nr:thioredoxin [Deltaproteobacteria bacterium]MBW2121856.1 thioredoxin [Deltaproteobacteria bacterium]